MKRFNRACGTLAFAVAAIACAAAPASAHPHVWITMAGQLVFAPDGSATGVRYDWAFDDLFSAFALQGLKARKAGEFTRQELAPLAQENVTSLKEYRYFTDVKVNGKKVEVGEPADYYLDYERKTGVLTLHFTLAFKTPIKARQFNIEVYDPEFFIDFELKKIKDPMTLSGAPAGCKLTVERPRDLAVPPGQTLSEAFFNQLTAADNWGAQFANKMAVSCP